jgi:hypothetical protein
MQMAHADGLVYNLPPDRTSVRYEMEIVPTFSGEKSRKGSLTISSVGVTTVENANCRWIEFKNASKENDGREAITISKVLVPEEHLGRGKSSGEHLIRGWVKQDDNEPREIKELQTLPGYVMLAGYLAGPPHNFQELDKVEIDGKLGKQVCGGISGVQEFQYGNQTFKIHFENRFHEKAPFGVVSAAWKVEREINGRRTINIGTSKLTLVDVNTTAVSELPDRN